MNCYHFCQSIQFFFNSTSFLLSQKTSKHLSNKGEKGCQQNAMCGSSHDPCCDAEERHGASSSVSAIQDVCQEWVCDEYLEKQNATKMITVFHTGGEICAWGAHQTPKQNFRRSTLVSYVERLTKYASCFTEVDFSFFFYYSCLLPVLFIKKNTVTTPNYWCSSSHKIKCI